MPAPEVWLRGAIEEGTSAPAYPLGAPEGVALPFVVYQRSATAREELMDGSADSPLGTFDVAVYADSYAGVKDLADQVRLAVANFNGEYEGLTIQKVSLTDERDGDPVYFEGRELPTYLVEQTYAIRWDE